MKDLLVKAAHDLLFPGGQRFADGRSLNYKRRENTSVDALATQGRAGRSRKDASTQNFVGKCIPGYISRCLHIDIGVRTLSPTTPTPPGQSAFSSPSGITFHHKIPSCPRHFHVGLSASCCKHQPPPLTRPQPTQGSPSFLLHFRQHSPRSSSSVVSLRVGSGRLEIRYAPAHTMQQQEQQVSQRELRSVMRCSFVMSPAVRVPQSAVMTRPMRFLSRRPMHARY